MSKSTIVICGIVLVVVFGVGSYGFSYYKNIIESERTAANAAALRMQKKDVSITIIEGKRREEIAAEMQKAGICTSADFLAASLGKEGMLFPDTYRFFPTTPAADVVTKLVQNFQDRTSDLEPSASDLVLASIVEREALNDSQRAIIAGVYTNRIKIGMRLEADPTVQYAKDSNALAAGASSASYSFWSPITQDDYHGVISPYNTYLNDGIPPTPIDNPGRASIVAAMNPAHHNYLYFINRDGKLLLSKTLAEHQSKQ